MPSHPQRTPEPSPEPTHAVPLTDADKATLREFMTRAGPWGFRSVTGEMDGLPEAFLLILPGGGRDARFVIYRADMTTVALMDLDTGIEAGFDGIEEAVDAATAILRIEAAAVT